MSPWEFEKMMERERGYGFRDHELQRDDDSYNGNEDDTGLGHINDDGEWERGDRGPYFG